MDLSFPHGRAVSNNIGKESYLGTDFILTVPSIDHITNKIKQLGKGSLIYKIDISWCYTLNRHYRLFSVRVKAQNLLSAHLSTFWIQKRIPNFSEAQQHWVGQKICTKKELQSLLGSLLYISKCVHSSRFFLMTSRDLNWFRKFLPHFNGIAFFNHVPIRQIIVLDACLEGFIA